ncbi:leucyl aminopeptidase [Sphingomicrobium aestuariivivum]|uniref:leucyl aminopeptidase n=1 Tax=Sphingomicrobium aestuariivivum TaxID=1582356 RepID=UPI001FD70C8E|nr:leucyl aminopeptidase [Sphingomicrobium aestuariivivum]MCJ8190035.1 leucyl aminopeptidase [Sphingomicrobium aestuariivivum]
MQIQFATARPDADHVLVLPATASDDAALKDLPGVVKALEKQRFEGKRGKSATAWIGDDGQRLLVVGVGEGEGLDLETLGATIPAQLATSGETHAVLDLSSMDIHADAAARAALGAVNRAWNFDHRTKKKDEEKVTLETLTIVGAPHEAKELWEERYQPLSKGIALTRELVTEPANIIYPESFVERVKSHAEGTGLVVEALDEKEMEKLGMGALLGVAQGSVRKPRLLVMKWMGGEGDDVPLLLVGKGVTFDTGGISIKPAAGMESMKWDMGGAGAVSGAMLALAAREAKANVVGICGLVENMPDGNAQRPGDVVTSMSGQTIEVINTDAEGRLVLCDALTWGQKEFSPKTVLDLATLTGAMVISLGHEQAGFFTNSDDLAEDLIKASKKSGDKLWRQPLGEAYDRLIDSPIADMKNVGPREAGSITAAQFLQRFIEDGVDWAHLDIAGMAWSDKAKPTIDKGATGFGVRVLDMYVQRELED